MDGIAALENLQKSSPLAYSVALKWAYTLKAKEMLGIASTLQIRARAQIEELRGAVRVSHKLLDEGNIPSPAEVAEHKTKVTTITALKAKIEEAEVKAKVSSRDRRPWNRLGAFYEAQEIPLLKGLGVIVAPATTLDAPLLAKLEKEDKDKRKNKGK